MSSSLSIASPKTLQEWRTYILDRFLLVLFPLGTFTAIVDIGSFIINDSLARQIPTVIVEIIGIILVGGITFRRTLPYTLRASVPIVILFIIGFFDLVKDGINVDGRYLFLISIIFSVVFFGGRTGAWVFAVIITLMAGRLVLWGPGRLDTNIITAITDMIIFTFVSAIAAVPAAHLIDGLTDSTEKALNLAYEAEAMRHKAEEHAQEVTRSMQALMESRARLATTQAERDQTERLLHARSDAVRMVVHDLNHTVQGIQSALDLWLLELRSAQIDGTVVAFGRDRLYTALEQQRTLLSEMRDAALLESGNLILQPILTDLGALARKVAAQLQPRYDLAECILTVTVADDLPAAWCDPHRVQRVIYNILENAFRYTVSVRDGGIVQLNVTSDDDAVICIVQDNGRGIAATDLERLGQKFARLAEGEGDPEGMGLGLNFAIGIMRLSNGTLVITSPGEGQGTTVTLRLPRAHHLSSAGFFVSTAL